MNEKGLMKRLLTTIESLPGVSIDQVEDRGHLIHLKKSGGGSAMVRIEARKTGFPRDLREVARRLCNQSAGAEESRPLIAAPSISPGAREMLRDMGVGYWDQSGSLFLSVPWGVYFVDRPPVQPPRKVRNLYNGRSAQVVHALLISPEAEWSVTELAEISEVSLATAHQVLRYLEDQLWVDKQGSGPNTVRRLRDPGALIDHWAEAHSLSRYEFHHYFRLARTQEELTAATVQILESADVEYALTLSSGAALRAPFLVGPPAVYALVPYLPSGWSTAVQSARLQPAESGYNITFMVPPDRSSLMFTQSAEDVIVASDVQLYLDLWAWPQRGQEQAKHLRRQRLPY